MTARRADAAVRLTTRLLALGLAAWLGGCALPAGQRVFNIELDAQGRVARVEQALSEALFPERIRPDHWTRADVLREYGPPARVMGVHNFDGDIWLWRYADGPVWRLLHIDIDRSGVVRGWSSGDEPLPDVPESR